MNEGTVRGWDKLRSYFFFVCIFVSWAEESPRSFYGFWKIEDGIFTTVWRASLKYGWILGKNFYCLFSTILFSAFPSWYETMKKLFFGWKSFCCVYVFFCLLFPHLQICMKIAEYLSVCANENSFYGWRLFHSFFNSRRKEKIRFCCDFNETDRLKYFYAQSFYGLWGIISLSLEWHSVVKLKKR